MRTDEFNDTIVPMRAGLKEYACRLAGNPDEADDMVQEVMLRLWNMRSRLDVAGRNKSLAFTILRNLANDRWRHLRHESGSIAGAEPIGDDGTGPEVSDEAALVRTIVERLPVLQRMLFRMKEIEGYDSNDIMRITGCSAESLRKNLSRARQNIRREFVRLTSGTHNRPTASRP